MLIRCQLTSATKVAITASRGQTHDKRVAKDQSRRSRRASKELRIPRESVTLPRLAGSNSRNSQGLQMLPRSIVRRIPAFLLVVAALLPLTVPRRRSRARSCASTRPTSQASIRSRARISIRRASPRRSSRLCTNLTTSTEPAKAIPCTAAAMPVITDGGKTWTIKLKPGIRFADAPAFKGKPRELVAEDYVYSIKRALDPNLLQRRRPRDRRSDRRHAAGRRRREQAGREDELRRAGQRAARARPATRCRSGSPAPTTRCRSGSRG